MTNTDSSKRWQRVFAGRHLLWAALVVVALGAAAWAAVLGMPGHGQPAQGKWVAVTSQVQKFELTATGRVAPARLIEIPSAATGTLDDVKVAWGDRVEQGQRLVRIASVELDAQLRTAEAAVLRARVQDGGVLTGEEPADVLNARRRLVSAKGALQTARGRAGDAEALYAKGFVSRLDRDSAALEAESTGAQVAVAEEDLRAAALKYAPEQLRALRLEAANRAAELEQLRQRQALLRVAAPLAGVVLQPAPREGGGQPGTRELVQGAKVASGDPVLAIGDTSSLLLQASCGEADMAWLDPGMPAQVTVAALPGHTFEARVARLGTATRARQSFSGEGGPEFECEFTFVPGADALPTEDRHRLRIGGTAKVRMSHAAVASQASIPVAAVVWSPDGRAQVRWRASPQDAAQNLTLRVARAGVDDVQLRDALAGEVWVAAGPNVAAPPTSFLSRMLGFNE